MSYYPFETKENTEKYKPENFIKKQRFIKTDKKDYFCDTPGFWNYGKKQNVIDEETNLITPGVGTRQKTKVEMTQPLHPNNYDVPISNVIEEKEDEKIYFSGYGTGPGRGFGNLTISNNIRFGDFTRTETKHFKANKESEVIDRWEYIDNRFQNPTNLIMPIPRGGESTRKTTIELSNSRDISKEKEFVFKY